MDILKHFVENEVLKKAVYQYFEDTIKEEVLNRAFADKDITGYAEAKRILDKTFNNLEGKYGKQTRTTQDSR